LITNSVCDNREQRSNRIVRTFFVDRSVDTDLLEETLLLHGYSVERHQALIDKHAAAINEILVCKEPPYIVHLTKERVRLVWPTES